MTGGGRRERRPVVNRHPLLPGQDHTVIRSHPGTIGLNQRRRQPPPAYTPNRQRSQPGPPAELPPNLEANGSGGGSPRPTTDKTDEALTRCKKEEHLAENGLLEGVPAGPTREIENVQHVGKVERRCLHRVLRSTGRGASESDRGKKDEYEIIVQ